MRGRPVLRYHGGKWMLAPWILTHLPPHRIYVEPYGGAGSVLLRKERSYCEVYNDLWDGIVTLFRVLRDPDQAAELERRLRLTPFARTEFEAASMPPPDDPVEMARCIVVRSLMGFGSAASDPNYNTGFRSNSNRSGTTPVHDFAAYPDLLPWFTARLRGVVIENRPALEVMAQHDSPGTCHYVDPPYVHTSRTPANPALSQATYTYEMTDADHRALAECLHGLEGMVVLSGYWTDLYEELFGGWVRIDRLSHADGARKRRESLWFNPPAARQATLFSAVSSPRA